MSADELVNQYIKIRDHIAARKKELDTELVPYKEGQTSIGIALREMLKDLDVDSLRCNSGTAFNKTNTSDTVSNPEAFLKFLMETGLWEIMDLGVNTAALNMYLSQEEGRVLPPGVSRTSLTAIQVRRK